jgi:quercetin dioxygenase-like cupin family protein
MSTVFPRRIVTGHDEHGASIVVSDAPPSVIDPVPEGDAHIARIWGADAHPIPLSAQEPDAAAHAANPPHRHGHVGVFCELGPGWRSPLHRTESLDYAVVLRGEIHLTVDATTVVLHPGDVVVQRATDHLWENPGDEPALLLVVMIGGVFTDELRTLLGDKLDAVVAPIRTSTDPHRR